MEISLSALQALPVPAPLRPIMRTKAVLPEWKPLQAANIQALERHAEKCVAAAVNRLRRVAPSLLEVLESRGDVTDDACPPGSASGEDAST